ncbi:hypothetical protein GYMLUDRAFT_180122 [Collybiopsis luxurians FD-317 M1]|uniref:Uncharacterized protein n=1 Tax=Collybiopsis luxurians FD-317 M1 TaxID=944289 RepID=A0A0D0C3L0_9AGAR|nr:hypothetical protein GYMLUDRAFT_180122 [Collybiopsis luxurians FD-317 M1]
MQRLTASNPSHIPKMPRVLLTKLGEMERKISERIATGNYASMSGSTKFWMKHCSAVPLGKSDGGSLGTKKMRKPQTCNRCQTIIYPGPKNSPENHKLGYCSDSVSQKATHIQWPQTLFIRLIHL